MFLHKNSGDLDGLRRVEGEGVGVLMTEESRQKRLEIFQKGSQKNPRYPPSFRVDVIWTELRKIARGGFGCQRRRT